MFDNKFLFYCSNMAADVSQSCLSCVGSRSGRLSAEGVVSPSPNYSNTGAHRLVRMPCLSVWDDGTWNDFSCSHTPFLFGLHFLDGDNGLDGWRFPAIC